MIRSPPVFCQPLAWLDGEVPSTYEPSNLPFARTWLYARIHVGLAAPGIDEKRNVSSNRESAYPGIYAFHVCLAYSRLTRFILFCSMCSLFSRHYAIRADLLHIINPGRTCWRPCGTFLHCTRTTTVIGHIRKLACITSSSFKTRKKLCPIPTSQHHRVNSSRSFTEST